MVGRYTLCILIALVGSMPPPVAAGPAAQPFTLGEYIPQNCWMYIHGVDNPERGYIEAHWSRVFEAVKNSGIDVELKTLIGSGMPQAERAEFEQAWDAAMQLVHGVRWGDLMAKETVLAERLGSVAVEIILLCRSSPDSVESNLQGLRAILNALAALSDSSTVTERHAHGSDVWSLDWSGSPMQLHVFSRDDIVGIVFGDQAVNDILALLNGKKDVGAIVDAPRFKKAFADLPPPEDSRMFFDFQMFVDNLGQMFETVFSRDAAKIHKKGEEARRGPRIIMRLFDHFNFIDYIAAVSRTDGLREITTGYTRLRSDAMNKPLCRMLTSRRPFETFDRLVPREATGFSVTTFLDLEEAHKVLLEVVRDHFPGGANLLDRWAGFQEDIGFDIEADLFSWWSGEIVSVDLPPAVKGPFASADFAWFIRVKDPRLATAKVNAGIDRLDALLRKYDWALMISDVQDVDYAGLFLFSIEDDVQGDLARADAAALERLRTAFSSRGVSLAPDATVSVVQAGEKWEVFSGDLSYTVESDGDKLNVSHRRFRSLTHPIFAMQGIKFIVGVADEYLVISNSASAINACLATAQGGAPSILENERFKKEGLVPRGPVCSASFTDLSNLGQEMGQVFFLLGLAGTFIPDEPDTRPVKAVIGMFGRLSPAIAQLDFFSSSATVCTFDGQSWKTEQVLNYKPAPPPKRAPRSTPAATTAP